MDIQTAKKSSRKIFTPYLITVCALTLASIICYVIFSYSSAFSDFVQSYIGGPIRFILAKITNLLPFSLAELLLISSPVILTATIYTAVKKFSFSWKDTFYFMSRALSLICIVAIIFVFGFAGGYKGETLDKKLGMQRKNISATELYYTAEYLKDQVNTLCEEISFVPNSYSVMPYSFSKMTDLLNDAYDSLSEKHPFIQSFDSNPKQVVLSEPWTYTHISGVYTFFTGESNININFPDYTLPFTCAHEMAHQRGISREDEANFVAFLVCAQSSDPYIRYSGYLSLYEYVRNALYSASPDLYTEVALKIDTRARLEMNAYSEFFDKYRDNIVADVSGSINNSYLQSQGTVGTKSYGMVVDLACAYVYSLGLEK